MLRKAKYQTQIVKIPNSNGIQRKPKPSALRNIFSKKITTSFGIKVYKPKSIQANKPKFGNYFEPNAI